MPIGDYPNSWNYYSQKKFEEDLDRYLSKDDKTENDEEDYEDDDD